MSGTGGAELRCDVWGARGLQRSPCSMKVLPACEADLVHGNASHPCLPSASVLKEWRFLRLSVSAYVC